MSKDTFYFSHDYNARNDIKIKKLLSIHGLFGYGIFWALIEELYNNANALPTDYDTIAFDLRTDRAVLISVINDFQLFVIDGDFFGSFSVQSRLDKRNETSQKARESANKRWKNANALQAHSEPNAIKERKVKEIKVKESKGKNVFDFRKSLIEYGFKENLVDDWLRVRKTKKATNTETAFKAFIATIEQRPLASVDFILETCCDKSWSGFKWEWIDSIHLSQPNNQTTSQPILAAIAYNKAKKLLEDDVTDTN